MAVDDHDFGETLYRILPQVYRNRDESGDLRAYLAGCGDLLDAVYATLRQRYADNYPDNPPEDAAIAPCQDWLIPYFADLVDARLVSPLAEGRRTEVGQAIRWRQGKGSVATLDAIVEGIGQSEAVLREGWRRVATTPRLAAPLGTAAAYGYAQEPVMGNPGNAARHPGLPAVTVDLRCPSRAVVAEPSSGGAETLEVDGQTVIWRQASRHGAPCFPDSYEDVARRTPDVRTPDWRVGHHHPRRVVLYVPPPAGFFPPGQPTVAWNANPSAAYLAEIEVDEPEPGVQRHRARSLGTRAFVPVRVTGNPNLDSVSPQPRRFVFEGIAFTGTMRTAGRPLTLNRCAVGELRSDAAMGDEPAIEANGCLLRLLRVATALARLESVTVLERCIARRLQASEGLFLGPITRAGGAETAPPVDGCLRYSTMPRDQATGAMTLYRTTREAAVLVTNTWAERGCGVLTPASHRSVLTGAEDEGEIGAFHPAHHARLRRAILDKLADFLPVGLEAVLVPDPRLTEPPYAFD